MSKKKSRSTGKRKRAAITRDLFFKTAEPRFAWVDVEGWGRVGICEVSQLQFSRRQASYYDADGNEVEEEIAKQWVHAIIDQVMIDKDTPMFTDRDFRRLAQLSAKKLEPITLAIIEFNGPVKNEQGESVSTSKSSEVTTASDSPSPSAKNGASPTPLAGLTA